MKNQDFIYHVRGESKYIDDAPVPEGTLYASIYRSPSAHARILSIDTTEAYLVHGVQKIILAKDIIGVNQIGGIIADEPLLAENEVHYMGQPVAVVLASNLKASREASGKISINLENLPVITEPREAFNNNQLIIPPRIFSAGDTDSKWKDCDIIVEGTAESGAQEHLYLETQGALAFCQEGGNIKIISSTQAPTAVQRAVSRVTGLPMNRIEVEVLRLGGAFGGKEDQANSFAAMAALASVLTKKPVKLVLSRQEDMQITGKRHPYSSNFKIGLSAGGKILAYEVTFYQNAGAAADLSPAILDRTLFHCANSYFIPDLKATGYSCRTNLPPNTAFRGFGGPQGMFAIEAAIYKAAEKMGVDASEIQKKNLLDEGDFFHYGQKAENCFARRSWTDASKLFNVQSVREEIRNFNRQNKLLKKGMALMPVCFGISFTNTFMNQASALVHVYSDGSIGLSTAAVEMGQGVNMKLRQVVSTIFSVNIDKVRVETSNTTRVANTSPTAASSAADLNGKATEAACMEILGRLKKTAAEELRHADFHDIDIINEEVLLYGEPTGISWTQLVNKAFLTRKNLSSHAHYATPEIYFDREINKGRAFNYHVYGTGIIEVTLDCLRGTYKIDSVKIVHDFGKSLNPIIDRGQAEGAVLQGIGWLTMEEVLYDTKGKLLTDSLSTYKIPDIYFAPGNIQIEFLQGSANPLGIFNSKAIGEPPLMYGIAAYFALLNAMKAFRPERDFSLVAPLTPERVLLALYRETKESVPV